MISVFTPSHDPKYLDQAYESLKNQTHQAWEWIVLLNGDAIWHRPEYDDRVRIVYARPDALGVGALKKNAVEFCTGDILVELDHDDILMPTALEEIAKAFSESPKASMVYSDFSYINENATPSAFRYDASFGWEYRKEDGYNVCCGMEPSPHNVSYIWYAPNHVRAFRADLYHAVGGYNTQMTVLDDQDIMFKLFLYGDFVHIKKNLYLQRVHSDNTQTKEGINAFIQTETVRLHQETIQPMMLAWAKRNGLLALDLGGAHNPEPGYLSVDMHQPANLVGDIFDVLDNLDDNSVGVIRAVDFLEHIPDKIRLWNEMYRVLAHGGMVLSLTPSTDGRGAFQDPTHNSFYNENSFWYFADEQYRKYVPELKMDFQIDTLATYFPSDWHKKHNISYVNANLIALKGGGRQGGRLGI
jgi:glycosyltransferase involved in cell wall biosynthesis